MKNFGIENFGNLIEQRQELVYNRGLSINSDVVVNIDNELSKIVKSINGNFSKIVMGIITGNSINIDILKRWIKFYSLSSTKRHIIEKANQIMGYNPYK